MVLYGHQLSGNLKALYQEWQRSYRDAFDCFFLSLDPQYSQQLRAQGVPILQCSRLLDMLLVGRCDTVITDHGLHAMSLFIPFTTIRFIDVWHGIPYKGFTPDDFRVQHRYDEVWVSSPLLKDIYQRQFGFKPEIVLSLGYARTDKLFLQQLPDPVFREYASIPAGHRIVLYAPTWQQDDSDRDLFPFGQCQDTFIHSLSAICRKHAAILVIRSHLNANISSETCNNVRYCSMKDFPDTESLLQHTDILICDWSSIAFDYLALNRPTLFLEVDPPFKNGFSLDKTYRFGKVVTSMEMLCETLARILQLPNSYAMEQGDLHREITCAVYGQNTDGKVANRQLSRLMGLIAQT